jgi:hypothetical protein
MDKKEELREIKEILRKTSPRTFYFSFLKQVADEKKDNIIKRVALFPVLLNDRFEYGEFKAAWFDIIKVHHFVILVSGNRFRRLSFLRRSPRSSDPTRN